MTKFLNKCKLYFKKFLYLFPSPLPIGLTEFDNWAKDVLTTYGWPDNDSFRFALASMIINQGPAKCSRSKYYFSKVVHAAASKQVAGDVFYSLKMKQKAEALAQNKLAEAAATSSLSVVANESVQK